MGIIGKEWELKEKYGNIRKIMRMLGKVWKL